MSSKASSKVLTLSALLISDSNLFLSESQVGEKLFLEDSLFALDPLNSCHISYVADVILFCGSCNIGLNL